MFLIVSRFIRRTERRIDMVKLVCRWCGKEIRKCEEEGYPFVYPRHYIHLNEQDWQEIERILEI